MSENTNERLDRYTEADSAIRLEVRGLRETTLVHRANHAAADAIEAHLNILDDEQAELRAEVAKWRSSYATLCRALVLAKRDSEAAEAERDRARSLAATLEARLAQVEELHIPCSEHPTCADDDNFCHECGQDSPCTTARFLHPEESA